MKSEQKNFGIKGDTMKAPKIPAGARGHKLWHFSQGKKDPNAKTK